MYPTQVHRLSLLIFEFLPLLSRKQHRILRVLSVQAKSWRNLPTNPRNARDIAIHGTAPCIILLYCILFHSILFYESIVALHLFKVLRCSACRASARPHRQSPHSLFFLSASQVSAPAERSFLIFNSKYRHFEIFVLSAEFPYPRPSDLHRIRLVIRGYRNGPGTFVQRLERQEGKKRKYSCTARTN